MSGSVQAPSLQTPLRVHPAAPQAGAEWRPLADLSALGQLVAIPIGARELLNLAQSLPIAVSAGDAGLHVAAIIHPALLASPAVRRGQWSLAYKPLAIRALPFFPVDPETGGWRSMLVEADVAASAPCAEAATEQDGREPFFLGDGRPAPSYRRATGTLLQLIEGARPLQRAAETLLGADLLAPLIPPESVSLGARSLLVTDPGRMARLSARRVQALARDDFLALDLMTASHFSQRLLAPKVGRASADGPPVQASWLPDDLGIVAVDLAVDGMRLDDSALFSIDRFLAARPPGGKPLRDP
jgi:hypothetical protein